jgi:hypothetical protein
MIVTNTKRICLIITIGIILVIMDITFRVYNNYRYQLYTQVVNNVSADN